MRFIRTRIAAISTATPTKPGIRAASAAVPKDVMAATLPTCGLPGIDCGKVNEPAARMPRMNFLGTSQISNTSNAMGYIRTTATPAETTLRSKISGLKFGKYMRVFTICTAYTRAPDFYSQVLFPELASQLPNRPLFPYQFSLVGLLDTDENGTIPSDLSEILTAFAQKHHLIIGVSNIFSNISRFAEYAEQARRAPSFFDRFSRPSPFFFYLDYGLYIILDRIHDEKLLAQCCHPALERLSQYDAKRVRKAKFQLRNGANFK